MTQHFPTVQVDWALRAARHAGSDPLRPLTLVVDDDPIITATLAAILNGSGLAALGAQDGLAALDIALLIPPEILIADLGLPGMNGLDLAIEVTRGTPDCDVILFVPNSASASVAAKMRSFGREFVILLKPVHPVELLDAVFAVRARRGHPLDMLRTFRSPGAYHVLSSAHVQVRANSIASVKRRLREQRETGSLSSSPS